MMLLKSFIFITFESALFSFFLLIWSLNSTIYCSIIFLRSISCYSLREIFKVLETFLTYFFLTTSFFNNPPKSTKKFYGFSSFFSNEAGVEFVS